MAYLQVSVTTPGEQPALRRPMNLAIVLDRSGSMAEDGKIENAKRALYSLIDQLTSEDLVSIVSYDDVINVLCETQRAVNKAHLKSLVEGIFPRGSTNLGGGMVEGFRQVGRNASKEFVNRVILLSDGLANQGITDSHELDRIAQQYRSRSISLSTMGVGLDYNENLMAGLSEAGGGNYYFIECPNELAFIVRKELSALSSIIAQNACIELSTGANVCVMDAIGCESHSEGSHLIIPVGDLYVKDRREFTVELQVPEGTGEFIVASGVLRYDDRRLTNSYPSFRAMVRYSKDVAEIEKHRDWDTEGKAEVAVSTRRVENAMKALDEGNQDEAARELETATMFLSASPAASQAGTGAAAIHAQMEKMDSYRPLLKDSTSDTRRAKKSIQYDNLQTLRKK